MPPPALHPPPKAWEGSHWTGPLTNGETVTDGAMRETFEETGLQVDLTGLLNVYTYPAAPVIMSGSKSLAPAFVPPTPGTSGTQPPATSQPGTSRP